MGIPLDQAGAKKLDEKDDLSMESCGESAKGYSMTSDQYKNYNQNKMNSYMDVSSSVSVYSTETTYISERWMNSPKASMFLTTTDSPEIVIHSAVSRTASLESQGHASILSEEGIEDLGTENFQNEQINKKWRFFVNMLTCLYTLIIIIFSLIIEVSPIWGREIWVGYCIFFLFMYGAGIVYLLYCYIFMIYPQTFNFLVKLLAKYRLIKSSEDFIIRHSDHTGEGAGTLYLRLGALFFGCAGIVLFGLEIFLSCETYAYNGAYIAQHVTAMLFTFIQMHFLFCNSKIQISFHRNISKWGLMHLAAVNIWTWIRFVLAKQGYKVYKKNKKYATTTMSSSSSSEEDEGVAVGHGFLSEVVNQTIQAVLENITETTVGPVTTTGKPHFRSINQDVRLITFERFSDLTTFLTTCIVEYSLIGAAVMFILWGSIDNPHHHSEESEKNQPVKRKYKMRIDCSHSTTGLFVGIIFLVASVVSMGVYTVFEDMRGSKGAITVFGIVDLCLFSIALVACLGGLWRMRLLQYRLHPHGEVIDEILLVLGLTGEIVYCTVGIDIFITSVRNSQDEKSLLPIFVFCVRLIQVVTQTAFILLTSRLRCLSQYAIKHKPGKQIITFLLVSNITLFAFHTFEAMKANYGINQYASDIYNTIVFAVGPLLVFYRFHSSACLAEIWKHTYSTKVHDHHGSHSPGAHSASTVLTETTGITHEEGYIEQEGAETV